jgi:hypothetical protein
MKIGYLFDRECVMLSSLFSSCWIMFSKRIGEGPRDFCLPTFNLLHPFAYPARISLNSSGFCLPK